MNTKISNSPALIVLRVMLNFVRYCIFLVIGVPAEGDAFNLGDALLGVVYAVIFLLVTRVIMRACFRARSLANL